MPPRALVLPGGPGRDFGTDRNYLPPAETAARAACPVAAAPDDWPGRRRSSTVRRSSRRRMFFRVRRPLDLPSRMSADRPPSLLAALRGGTRDLHDRAEAAFVLGGPGVTRAEYVAVLARLLAFYAPAERALEAWAPALDASGLALAPRRKAPLLRRDLRALDPGFPRHAEPAFRLPDPAHALGALYVLEGATLGGQLLRRRLAPALGLTAEHGLAFLTGYGADVGPMWRAFGEALGRFEGGLADGARAAATASAVAGARATFAAFERWVVAPTARPTLAASA